VAVLVLWRAKQKIFPTIFCAHFTFLIFPLRKKNFLLCLSANAEYTAASHPQPRFTRQSRRAKIPSPRFSSFLPACLDARSASEAAAFWKGEKKKMRLPQPSRARAFEFLLPDFN